MAVLEAVWGEGYLSPGGSDEIRMIVEGVALAGKAVLDLGCGTGGITRFLAETYRRAFIVGIDAEHHRKRDRTRGRGRAWKTA